MKQQSEEPSEETVKAAGEKEFVFEKEAVVEKKTPEVVKFIGKKVRVIGNIGKKSCPKQATSLKNNIFTKLQI